MVRAPNRDMLGPPVEPRLLSEGFASPKLVLATIGRPAFGSFVVELPVKISGYEEQEPCVGSAGLGGAPIRFLGRHPRLRPRGSIG